MKQPWDAYKETLRELYLVQDLTTAEVVQRMEVNHEFRANAGQYERQFNKWGFRKNLKRPQWEWVLRRVEKRKQEGKESDLKIDGVLVPKKKIHKAGKHHRPSTLEEINKRFQQAVQNNGDRSRSSTPEGLMICTPISFYLPTLALNSLPWFQFRSMFRPEVPTPNKHTPLSGSYHDAFEDTNSAMISVNNDQWNQISRGVIPAPGHDNELLRVRELFQDLGLSGFDRFAVAVLFSTNGLFNSSLARKFNPGRGMDTGASWSRTLLRFFRSQKATSILENLVVTDCPTVDALSEMLFKEALTSNDFEVVRLLIRHSKVDVDAVLPGPWEFSSNQIVPGAILPLEVAIRGRNFALVEMLINSGAKAEGLLHLAIVYGTPDILTIIINTGVEDLSSVFLAFTHCGYYGCVEKLLDQGISPNSKDPQTGIPALLVAALAGKRKVFCALLDRGADANMSVMGITALHVAAYRGEVWRARRLLAAGADMEKTVEKSADPSAFCVPTPLQIAAYCGNYRTASLLLKQGANVNANAPRIDISTLATIRASIGKFATYGFEDTIVAMDGLTTLACALSLCERHAHEWKLDDDDEYDDDDDDEYDDDDDDDDDHNDDDHNDDGDHNDGDDHYHDDEEEDDLGIFAKKKIGNLLKLLLSYGVDVAYGPSQSQIAASRCSALAQVIRSSDLTILKTLEDAGAPYFADSLHEAIISRNWDMVWRLVEAGVDVNEPALDGRSSLTLATNYREGEPLEQNLAFCKFLLRHGADVNHPRVCPSALEIALDRDHINMAKLLLDHGARCNKARTLYLAVQQRDHGLLETILHRSSTSPSFDTQLRQTCFGHPALYLAVWKRDRLAVNMLLDWGVNVKLPCAVEALRQACIQSQRSPDVDLLPLLLSTQVPVNLPANDHPCACWPLEYKTNRFSPLQAALQCSNIKAMDTLLRHGADPNFYAEKQVQEGDSIRFGHIKASLLSIAADIGSFPAVSLLVNYGAGANVNAPALGDFGRTALQAAAEGCNMPLVEYLLALGADVNAPPARSRGVTALQAAAIGGYCGIASKLLEHRADVNAAGAEKEGRTALEGAAEQGRIDMVRLLLDAGADLDDNRGASQQYGNAVEMARRNGYNAVANLLMRYQAGER